MLVYNVFIVAVFTTIAVGLFLTGLVMERKRQERVKKSGSIYNNEHYIKTQVKRELEENPITNKYGK